MNEEMIRRSNLVVKPGDTIYHIGDFSLKITTMERILPRLFGRHVLVPGNHDMCHHVHRKHKKMTERYEAAGFTVSSTLHPILRIEDTCPASMCHFPYRATMPEDEQQRYAQWRPEDKGGWLLHGHVHCAWRIKERMINVGVDVWDYSPVSLEEIMAIIDG
jgi:calcineurin-like phosphoesterase family protein